MKLTAIFLSVLIGCVFTGTTIAQRTVPGTYTGPLNYVKSWDLTAPISNPADVLTKPNADVKLSTQYIDGLGRTKQTVVRKGSLESGSTAKDLVSPLEYDDLGREIFQYLPYAESSANDGSFKTGAFASQASFMNSVYGGQGETWFYNQTEMEASPLNRPARQMSAGNNWVGAARGVSIKYWNNTASDAVKKWNPGDIANELPFNTTSGASTGTYNAGDLVKIITIDEHGKQVIEFKDRDGKVILKKVQMTATADDGTGKDHSGWLCTYYIYDIYNNLRCVVQPVGVELLAANSWNLDALSDKIQAEQCFMYAYDQRNRMIMKKVPGAGYVGMVYDARDRLVITQDANMRAKTVPQFAYTRYDELNRPVETGLYEWAYSSIADYWAYAADKTDFPWNYWGPIVPEVLTSTWYDNYSFPWGPFATAGYNNSWDANLSTNYSSWPYPQQNIKSFATKGLVTGTRTKILGTSTYTYTANIYDEKGRVIQVHSTNISGGTDALTTQFTWAGLPYRVLQKHQNASGSSQEMLIVTHNTYDELGRIINIEKKQSHSGVNSNAMSGLKTIATLEYDKLGQLKQKKLSPDFGTNGLENLDYEYNIRGWMLGMNRAYTRDANNSNYFGFDLGYDKTNNGLVGSKTYNAAQYNGNITGTVWKSKGDGEKRRYDYKYDAANRITTADFTQYTDGNFDQSAGVNFNVQMGSVTSGIYNDDGYDANGNIKQMQQWSFRTNSSTQVDDLRYQYFDNGNRLKSVTEFSLGTTDNKLGDFTDNNAGNDDYDYDVNGNLVLDKNKAISGITYNYLNLPSEITVTGNGTITYTYDAGGNKLKKETEETSTTVVDGANTYNNIKIITTTHYIAGFVYESKTYNGAASGLSYSNKFQFAGHEEGRIRATYTNPAQPHTLTGLTYDYMLKDHLGNVRALLTEEDKDATYAATFEEDSRETEKALFVNIEETAKRINQVPAYPSDETTNPNGYTSKLDGYLRRKGASITLKVMAGDKVDIGTKVWYPEPVGSPGGNPLSPEDLLGILVTTLSTNASILSGGKGDVTVLSTTGSSVYNGLDNFLGGHSTSTGGPAAYLNWFLLDEQFKYVPESSGFIPVPAQDADIQTMASLDIEMTKSGYIFIYLSNETETPVYFDNFFVNHKPGVLLEESHYYPFGLTMEGISSKAVGSVVNRNKYNSKEEQRQEFSDGAGLYWMDYGARMYDGQIGRFFNPDRMVDSFRNFSPYTYAKSNPIIYIDINGDSAVKPISFHDPKLSYDRTIIKGIDKAAWSGGVNVFTHGTPYTMEIVNKNGRKFSFDPKEIVEAINSNLDQETQQKWMSGKVPLVLFACSTGHKADGEPGIAERISKEYRDAIIYAPNTEVAYNIKTGEYMGIFHPIMENSRTGGIKGPDTRLSNNPGSWKLFKGGKEINPLTLFNILNYK